MRWLVGLALLLTGCVPGNLQGVIREMAKSDRSWCVAATGYGVDIKAGGSGVGEGDMTCGGSGLTLKSQATQIGVPLTVVPQLSVGPPTLMVPPPRPAPVLPPRGTPQSAPAPEGRPPGPAALRIGLPEAPAAPGGLTEADLQAVRTLIREMHEPLK